MLPKNYALDEKQADQMIKLIEALEDHDDVQNVYTNFDVSDEVIAKVEK
jgi:transcriptional/translational regulatory protein YebC/TACO1